MRDEIAGRLLTLPGVEERPSRFGGGAAFHVAAREFAHFHSDEELDLRVGRREERAIRRRFGEDPRFAFRRNPADWVVVRIAAGEDLALLDELARIAWEANR